MLPWHYRPVKVFQAGQQKALYGLQKDPAGDVSVPDVRGLQEPAACKAGEKGREQVDDQIVRKSAWRRHLTHTEKEKEGSDHEDTD